MCHLKICNLLKGCIPDNHSRQVTSMYYVEYLLAQDINLRVVMDLGCGVGNSVDYFRRKNSNIRWVGVDIEESLDVELRARPDAEFLIFDGIHIPFDENYFDLIYCNQIFEHVRYPIDLLKEVHRVLRPDGYFVGSVSRLELCHSSSLRNYTPYGFRLLVEEIGLKLIELRLSIDVLTLILWHGLGRPRFLSQWNKESLFNRLINLYGKITGKSHIFINAVKLLFCDQFCFLVCKSEDS